MLAQQPILSQACNEMPGINSRNSDNSNSQARLDFSSTSTIPRTFRGRALTFYANPKNRSAKITMLAWMTSSTAFKRESSESLLLSSRRISWTMCHACENALLVKETMLNIKFNKLMDFTERVLAAKCFCHGRR